MDNKDFLLPGNGTISWLENCKRNNYMRGGYTGKVVAEYHPTHDCRMVVTDYTQPKDAYNPSLGRTKFFTSLTFYKKEIIKKSRFSQFEYERPYTFYFPYGTRFGCSIVFSMGRALSRLIDKARLLSNSNKNAKEISAIQSKQKAIIDLILKGTKDASDFFVIMNGVELPELTTSAISVAEYEKDWLPYFSDMCCNNHSKFENSSQGEKSREPIEDEFTM